MSWVLASTAQGKGDAREALAANLHWVDEQDIARTCCIINADNSASIQLANRVGYELRTTGRYRDAPIGIYDRKAGAGATG